MLSPAKALDPTSLMGASPTVLAVPQYFPASLGDAGGSVGEVSFSLGTCVEPLLRRCPGARQLPLLAPSTGTHLQWVLNFIPGVIRSGKGHPLVCLPTFI